MKFSGRRFCRFLATMILFAGVLARARAQGGPPMITDDPGTPGNGHWEINVGAATERAGGVTQSGLPQLDANYGAGDRVQLNYQTSWSVFRSEDKGTAAGLGDSQLAVKWRFYDAGEKGWRASMFPRILFLTPGTHSDRRGLADSGTSFLLPFEVQKDLGIFMFDADFGRLFSGTAGNSGWTGGICLGRQIAKGIELDAEIHAATTARANRSEVTANIGARLDVSASASLLLSIGRDIRDSIGPRSSLITYAGIQIRR